MTENDPIVKLQELKSFLRDHNSRGTPPVQMKILLRSKTKEITQVANHFLNDIEADPEEKFEKIIDGLGLLTEVEQLIPAGEAFMTPRMKYSALGNFFRNKLVTAFAHSNIARNYSSASILSNLLIDQIIHIEELPEFPSYQDPDAFNRAFGPIFNIVISTCGVFTSLLTVLPVMNKSDVDEWFTHIFRYMDLFRQLFAKFNVVALVSSKKLLDPEKLLMNVYNVANTQFTLIENLIQAYQIYQGELPPHLLEFGIVEDNSTEAFISYLRSIDEAKEKIEEEITVAKKNRFISQNIDVTQSQFYRSFTTNSRLLEYFIQRIRLYDQGIFENMDLLSEYLDSKNAYLERYVQHFGSEEEVVKSAMVSLILDQMREVIPFTAVLAIEQNDPGVFDDLIEKWAPLIEEYSYEKANELTVMRKLAELMVRTHLDLPIDYPALSQEIAENIDHVALQPRHFATLSILRIIAELYQGKPVTRNDEMVQMMMELSVPEMESWYQKDLDYYLGYLLGEHADHNQDSRKQVIMLDVFSWLCPDFSRKPLPTGRTLEFLPFNRKSDMVI